VKHYSFRTEEAYGYWICEIIFFHKSAIGTFRHPIEMGMPDEDVFLTHLAVECKVATSTQNQALSTIVFV
jgi:hypothetical protein